MKTREGAVAKTAINLSIVTQSSHYSIIFLRPELHMSGNDDVLSLR